MSSGTTSLNADPILDATGTREAILLISTFRGVLDVGEQPGGQRNASTFFGWSCF